LLREKAKFAALKVGYDGNADDDIDDAGDDLVVSSPFGSTAITPSHDDNGNLTDDGTYKYTYDAWNHPADRTRLPGPDNQWSGHELGHLQRPRRRRPQIIASHVIQIVAPCVPDG
jgi:hypothetical protein